MKVDFTNSAVVGEARAVRVAGIAGKYARLVRRREEEGQGVLRVKVVLDLSWQLEAGLMEVKVATGPGTFVS